MKNIFLIKNVKIFFSFGKDSYYSIINCFYKKKHCYFINYNYLNLNKIKLLFYFNININIIFIKKYNNELIMRKIRFSCIKNYDNIFFLKNHHYLDKIEFIFYNILKKKNVLNKNVWYKKYYFIKPYYNIFLKKNIKLVDKSNKNISIKRNFIRCLISFIK
ncbi:putative tRNA(Ile)-lysidine synthase [Candidatus Carsonella ruddii HT isolate Thao2000]|uniref:Putative tRNA(Ile)-lysidine synthase n=1 Tax=Candidatus Carsonella ruddii HT isolate Thao2000 TaxID=1202539 RepID=J3TW85_CARRU|nr:tRNA(Ile)-lysidine synthase [Candidatus Carsonella ruddii]AFP84070.1 putative tRNA(Ile)-lysidine synthase [Candidatus Carsonella ruddii HT isolate Thao2000]